jgi:hypothetical protein
VQAAQARFRHAAGIREIHHPVSLPIYPIIIPR